MSVIPPRLRSMVWRAWPFALIVLAIAIFSFRFHEVWRDEAGAMLEAREVPWRSLLDAMRLEGIPPLFHAMLKVASTVLPNSLALVAVGAFDACLLLWGTYRLLVAISDAPRSAARLTMAFAFTYVFAYELGVVIRQYTLGLGLALLAWAYLRNALRSGQRRDVHAGTIAAGLSALASAHSACVAGGVLLSFGCISLLRRRPWQSWSAIFWALPCFALDLYLAAPFPERTPEGNLARHIPHGSAIPLSLQALVAGIMPSDWWMVEAFVPPSFQGPVAMLRSLAFWGTLGAVLATIGARIAVRKIASRVDHFDLVAIFSSWMPLLVIIVMHYWGFYRHHLFLAVPALIVVVGHALDARVEGQLAGPLRRAGLYLLVPWFAFQSLLTVGSFALDLRYPFSDTRAASRIPVEGARLISDTEWRTLGVLFWRPDVHMRAGGWNGKPYRYLRPDRSWHSYAPITPLIVEECAADPDRVYFLGEAASLANLRPCASAIGYPKTPFETHPFTWESFDVFRMDCACVGAPADSR